jgi:predicted RNase H-like HicB family nuclease
MGVRYAIVIEKTERNYAAYVPDLPGCIAMGKTIEAVQRNMRGAIEMHLAGMREDGDPIPSPSSLVEYVDVAA